MSTRADAEHFYDELVSRNRGLIDPEIQRRLREARFVIAGCGSTGGACVGPLVRSGATRFVLVDPGTYELANLNRQDATIDDVGRNKADVQAERIRASESPRGPPRRAGRAHAGERRIPADGGRRRCRRCRRHDGGRRGDQGRAPPRGACTATRRCDGVRHRLDPVHRGVRLSRGDTARSAARCRIR